MNVNETIARWLGWTDIESWLEGYGIPPGGSPNTAKLVPLYDSGRAFWHGDDGLLAEIERRELIARFMLAMREVVGITTWAHMTATPAQLAAALVKVIEEAE